MLVHASLHITKEKKNQKYKERLQANMKNKQKNTKPKNNIYFFWPVKNYSHVQ